MKRTLPSNLTFKTPNDVTTFLTQSFGSHTIHNLLSHITHVTLLNKYNNVYNTIKTSITSPKHAFDTFMLNMCRASADAIIITGMCLHNLHIQDNT